MVTADDTIIIGIEFDDGSVGKAKIDASAIGRALGKSIEQNVGKSVDKSLSGLSAQFVAAATAAKIAFGAINKVVRSVEGFLSSAIDESIMAENSITAFNASLANMGAFSTDASKRMKDLATNLQSVGTVSADAVLTASTALVSIGGLTGDALDNATRAAVDLSKGLRIDLDSAFRLVAKAASGNEEVFSRYGITIDKNIPKSEKFAAVLGQINQRFAGLDASAANTFAGAVNKVTTASNDFLKSIGDLFTQSNILVAVIKETAVAISGFADLVKRLSQGDIVGNLLLEFLKVARAVSTLADVILVLGRITSGVFKIFLTGFAAIQSAFASVTAAAVNFGGQLSISILTAIAKISPALGLVFAAINNDLTNMVGDETKEKITAFKDFSIESFTELANSTFETFAGLGSEFPLTVALQGFLDKLIEAGELAPALAEQIKNGMAPPIAAMIDQMQKLRDKAKETITNGVQKIFSVSIQSIGAAVVKGKDAFANLGSAIFNILGDMAISTGETFLGIGAGIEAVRDSIIGLVGGPSIAAGIALIALGGLLKSLSGGGSTSTARSRQAGSPESTASPEAPNIEAPDTSGRQQAVNVIIQGNVLDRRETGLEIAQVLSEFFDNNGGGTLVSV